MKFAGQAAIVSGGASGLGQATAEALAAAGVKVTILDVNEAAAAARAAQRSHRAQDDLPAEGVAHLRERTGVAGIVQLPVATLELDHDAQYVGELMGPLDLTV